MYLCHCDGCGKDIATGKAATFEDKDGSLWDDDPRRSGSRCDLCIECLKSLKAWFESRKPKLG